MNEYQKVIEAAKEKRAQRELEEQAAQKELAKTASRIETAMRRHIQPEMEQAIEALRDDGLHADYAFYRPHDEALHDALTYTMQLRLEVGETSMLWADFQAKPYTKTISCVIQTKDTRGEKIGSIDAIDDNLREWAQCKLKRFLREIF